ncbi:hypothetical protein HK101_005886 [Irineochytrium annulatum]|nr:hypothetical protein HK101_005886 [Irineochytrium annulatum]
MSSVSSHVSSASTLFDPAHPHDHHHHIHHAGVPKSTPTPPPSPLSSIKPHHHVQTFHDTPDELARDAHLEPNERRARAAVRHALRNSRHMDDFAVTAIVGFGSNGVVLSALFHSRPVAIKIIYKTPNTTATPVPNEIAILEAISRDCPHPNILSHLRSWDDSRNHYLVTELHGVSPHPSIKPQSDDQPRPLEFLNPRLHRHDLIPVSVGSADLWSWSLSQSQRPVATTPSSNPVAAAFHLPNIAYPLNPPPLQTCRTIFAQLASALRHLHSAGVSHGDLKEENVLIDAQTLVAKLCDFGHADAPAAGSPKGGQRIRKYGTQEMTPPELLANLPSHLGAARQQQQHEVSADPFAADVFALGLVLYSLLHGPGCLPAAVHETVRNGRKLRGGMGYPLGVMRPDLDHGAAELLGRMTCVDPRVRSTMEDVVAHPWVRDVLKA